VKKENWYFRTVLKHEKINLLVLMAMFAKRLLSDNIIIMGTLTIKRDGLFTLCTWEMEVINVFYSMKCISWLHLLLSTTTFINKWNQGIQGIWWNWNTYFSACSSFVDWIELVFCNDQNYCFLLQILREKRYITKHWQ
jgi:hypothetical protein